MQQSQYHHHHCQVGANQSIWRLYASAYGRIALLLFLHRAPLRKAPQRTRTVEQAARIDVQREITSPSVQGRAGSGKGHARRPDRENAGWRRRLHFTGQTGRDLSQPADGERVSWYADAMATDFRALLII